MQYLGLRRWAVGSNFSTGHAVGVCFEQQFQGPRGFVPNHRAQ